MLGRREIARDSLVSLMRLTDKDDDPTLFFEIRDWALLAVNQHLRAPLLRKTLLRPGITHDPIRVKRDSTRR